MGIFNVTFLFYGLFYYFRWSLIYSLVVKLVVVWRVVDVVSGLPSRHHIVWCTICNKIHKSYVITFCLYLKPNVLWIKIHFFSLYLYYVIHIPYTLSLFMTPHLPFCPIRLNSHDHSFLHMIIYSQFHIPSNPYTVYSFLNFLHSLNWYIFRLLSCDVRLPRRVGLGSHAHNTSPSSFLHVNRSWGTNSSFHHPPFHFLRRESEVGWF